MGACLQVDLNGGLKGKDGFKGIGGGSRVKGQNSNLISILPYCRDFIPGSNELPYLW